MLNFVNFLLFISFCVRNECYNPSDIPGSQMRPQYEEDLADDECFEPLMIPCEINGYIIPAIVDTGAQITVMSESCARRCRVSNTIDGKFSGKAVGVGSSDILGRINELPMQVGPISFHNKVAILQESRVDLILGLDFLRRFKAEINLDERILKMKVRSKSIRISFLGNHNGPLRSPHDSLEYDEGDVIISSEDSASEEDSCSDNEYESYNGRNSRDRSPTRAKYQENKEKSRIPYSKTHDFDDFSFDEESDDEMRKGLFGVSMEGV